MVGRQDVEKRRAWEVRFERFRASGLSVTRFCEQRTDIGMHILLLGEACRVEIG